MPKNTCLYLGHLDNLATQEEIKSHIVTAYNVQEEDLEGLEFLVAFEEHSSNDYDGVAYFVCRDEDGTLYENYASYDADDAESTPKEDLFVDQWQPTETMKSLLNNLSFDGGADEEELYEQVHDHLTSILGPLDDGIDEDDEDEEDEDEEYFDDGGLED